MLLLAFSPVQLTFIIIGVTIFAAGIIANIVLLCVLFQRRKQHRLFTRDLRKQRKELLEELENLNKYGCAKKPQVHTGKNKK